MIFLIRFVSIACITSHDSPCLVQLSQRKLTVSARTRTSFQVNTIPMVASTQRRSAEGLFLLRVVILLDLAVVCQWR